MRSRCCIVVLVFSFALTGCNPEKEAVPDPERPPTPKVEFQGDVGPQPRDCSGAYGLQCEMAAVHRAGELPENQSAWMIATASASAAHTAE